MSAELLATIPGDIPGLLRHCSPVLVTINSDQPPVHGLVIEPVIEPDETDPRCLVWSERNGRDNKAAMFVRLDLTDPTGRVHAAWWFDAKPWGERRQAAGPVGGTPINPMIASDLLHVARSGADMTPEQIDLLARLVLRLAGRRA